MQTSKIIPQEKVWAIWDLSGQAPEEHMTKNKKELNSLLPLRQCPKELSISTGGVFHIFSSLGWPWIRGDNKKDRSGVPGLKCPGLCPSKSESHCTIRANQNSLNMSSATCPQAQYTSSRIHCVTPRGAFYTYVCNLLVVSNQLWFQRWTKTLCDKMYKIAGRIF